MHTFYIIEQGMKDPRDPTAIGWRHWSLADTKSAAIREAKKVTPLARVIEARCIWTS